MNLRKDYCRCFIIRLIREFVYLFIVGREGMITAFRASGFFVFAININSGVSCVKEFKSVKCDFRGFGDGVPWESLRYNIYI